MFTQVTPGEPPQQPADASAGVFAGGESPNAEGRVSAPSRQPDELEQAIKALTKAGAFFCEPPWLGSKSLRSAAAALDVSTDWLRDNLDEFPHWYRVAAGSARGRNLGEIRIPVADLREFERRRMKARDAA